MPTNADVLWAHARKLPEDAEPARRTKVSRAYYSLYHCACHFHDSLPSKGEMPPYGMGTHKRLIHQLTHPTVADKRLRESSKEVGSMLRRACVLRVSADYRLERIIGREEVSTCLSLVQQGRAAAQGMNLVIAA